MADGNQFSATGWSERDRLTRLETLQQTDAQAVAELRKGMNSIDAKLDRVIEQTTRRDGLMAFLSSVFKPLVPIAWMTLLAFAGWAATTYLKLQGR